MLFVLLAYGVAFFALGLILFQQVRLPLRPLDRTPLILLATFAIVHGCAEWLGLATIIETQRRWSYASLLATITRATTAFSFTLLLQFGVELLIGGKQRYSGLRALPLILVLALGGIVILAGGRGETFEAVSRYVLAIPASIIAARALYAAAQALRGSREQRKRSGCLFAAAAAFAIYAVAAGLIGPRAPIPPATLINAETFLEMTGIPIQIVRALCAGVIGACLAEALVIQVWRDEARLEEQRKQFAAIVAHDLRGPLTTIQLGADALAATGADPKLVQRLLGGVRSLKRLIDDLSDASRIEVRQLVLNRERLDLGRAVKDVVQQFAETVGPQRIEVNIREPLTVVEADRIRVEQILTNLLNNAVKYAEPGTPIVVTLEKVHGGVVVAISNTGPDIEPEYLTEVFSLFYRAPLVRTSAVPGLGIGLYVAKELTEAHGGRIWVESGERRTTFRITLPSVLSS